MKQRSSYNWKTKSGSWDALKTELISFNGDYPVLRCYSNEHKAVAICNDYKKINKDSIVSMFVDDYILERFWNNPVKYIEIFKTANCVMSPDYSLLIGMPKPMQMWNVYRNRLVGYVWQNAGINVIPTISWSDKDSFEYCFNGIEIGSIVAVSNTGCRNEEQKMYFDEGFKKMIDVKKPKKVLMQCGKKWETHYENENIIFLDSFWDNKRKNIA